MKYKAITFSFDDGVEQDKRLIEILDRYSLKCTFNINSGLFEKRSSHTAMLYGITHTFNNRRMPSDEIKDVYKNHEIAAHSITHPILTSLEDEEVIKEMKEDSEALEKLTGRKINGFAYPGGWFGHFDERVKALIKDNTQLYYGRTAVSSSSFDIPSDLMAFHPTVSHRELEKRDRLAEAFLTLKTDTPKLFYIWGHSYELDVDEKIWYRFERFCEKIAGRDDIFYGTNHEVFSYFGLK